MNDFDNFEYGFRDSDEMAITLTLEDDTELLCGVIAIFPAQDKDYIALTPLNEETDEVFICRFKLMDVDEPIPILENIEDDHEFKLVGEAFEKLFEEEEEKLFEEFVDDDDEFDQIDTIN